MFNTTIFHVNPDEPKQGTFFIEQKSVGSNRGKHWVFKRNGQLIRFPADTLEEALIVLQDKFGVTVKPRHPLCQYETTIDVAVQRWWEIKAQADPALSKLYPRIILNQTVASIYAMIALYSRIKNVPTMNRLFLSRMLPMHFTLLKNRMMREYPDEALKMTKLVHAALSWYKRNGAPIYFDIVNQPIKLKKQPCYLFLDDLKDENQLVWLMILLKIEVGLPRWYIKQIKLVDFEVKHDVLYLQLYASNMDGLGTKNIPSKKGSIDRTIRLSKTRLSQEFRQVFISEFDDENQPLKPFSMSDSQVDRVLQKVGKLEGNRKVGFR